MTSANLPLENIEKLIHKRIETDGEAINVMGIPVVGHHSWDTRSMDNRPLYCLPPMMLDWIGRSTQDRYMNYVAEKCGETDQPKLEPAEAVIQNQLFARKPL